MPRELSLYKRRMLVDCVWHQQLTEKEREACGGDRGRLRVKGWVTTTLDCPIDRADVIALFKSLEEKN